MGETGGKELERKKALLRAEGVEIAGNEIKEFENVCHAF